MGLQIPSGVDHEISLHGVGRRCGLPMSGVAWRDCAEQGNDGVCWCDQSGACAHVDRNPAADMGIEGGAVSEG